MVHQSTKSTTEVSDLLISCCGLKTYQSISLVIPVITRFIIKTTYFQYMNSHYKDKTVSRPSHPFIMGIGSKLGRRFDIRTGPRAICPIAAMLMNYFSDGRWFTFYLVFEPMLMQHRSYRSMWSHLCGIWYHQSQYSKTWDSKYLALIAQMVRGFGMNPKIGDSSPPQVETISV